MNQQSIPCPDCQTPIMFDPKLLVLGHNFSCTGCNAVLSLAPESSPVVKDALDKLEQIKKDAMKQAKQ